MAFVKAAHNIRLGATNTYLISGSTGWLLVDTGICGKEAVFFRRLREKDIAPEKIRLIVITHGHFDHVGALHAIKSRCRCPVLIHAADAWMIEKARIIVPPGISLVGRLVSGLGRRHPNIVDRMYRFPAVTPDIAVSGETSLEEWGFGARIVPTPGHTPGSSSLLTDGGDAFVGDLAFNILPSGVGNCMPPFAENRTALVESRQMLLKRGVTRIWPAHGFPFRPDRMLIKLRKQI